VYRGIPAAGMRGAATTRLTAFRQEGHGLRDDFMLAPLLSVFRLPAPLLQSPIHDDAVSLAEILATMFGLLAEHDNVHETDFLFQVITLLVAPAHRQSERRHRCPVRRVPQLGIAREISDQDDFVKPAHR